MNSSRCVAGLCFWFANITVRAREERSVRRHLLCFTRATREDNKKKSARNWKKVTVNSRGKGCLRKHFGYGKEKQEEKSKSLKLTSIPAPRANNLINLLPIFDVLLLHNQWWWLIIHFRSCLILFYYKVLKVITKYTKLRYLRRLAFRSFMIKFKIV